MDIKLEPKFVRELREKAEMEAERRLDGVRFVWFTIGVVVTATAMLVAFLV